MIFFFLFLLVPVLFIALQIFLVWFRHRLLVNDIKRAIIEAELEIRRGNFDLKYIDQK